MNIDAVIVLIISSLVLFAAFKYEREDLGCSSCFDTNVSACSDFNSVYVRDTTCSSDDNLGTMRRKLKKLISFDEAAGSWKRCVLWSFLLASLGYVIYEKGCVNEIKKCWLFAISWIVFMTVLYAMKSFESAHIYKIIKINGESLIDNIYRQMRKLK